ncbi:MAG: hypothetical protein ACJA2C_002724 [Marinoscillum sp.]|jgi:hypothetical protein
MKNLFALLFLILGVLNAKSQKTALEIYTEAQHTKTVKYQFDDQSDYLLLQSGFSKEEITRIPFSDQRIIKIDLVYTTFSEEALFDQAKLDQMRITNLMEINPQITVNKFFDWNIIGQTGCNSSPTCLELFHGFVIYYEPYFTKETSKAEIDSIKTYLKMLDQRIIKLKEELSLDYQRIVCEYPESLYSIENLSEKLEKIYDCSESYKGRVFFDVYLDYGGRVKEVKVNGNLFPCKEKLAKSLKYILQWKRGLTIGKQQYDLVAHGMVIFPIKKESVQIQTFEIAQELKEKYHMLQQYSQCVAYEVDTSFLPILPKVQKKVVSSVLFRNKLDPDLIIVDVTGSMYPYTADMLKWLKLLRSEKEKDFVFFNDGNDKPTAEKTIGNTEGLFHVKTADIVPARDKMFEAMRAGGGGDYPENNIEALLLGIDKCPAAKEVIMIADNYAFPRDVELLRGYQGKLKIILCHTEKGINTSYLDLAKRYGFSIHTLNTDLITLKEKVEIEGFTYSWSRDRYIRVK